MLEVAIASFKEVLYMEGIGTAGPAPPEQSSVEENEHDACAENQAVAQ